jgi:hypothetical protein
MAMPAVPGGGQHRAILAGVQAVRPRCAPGAAPGHRLRVTHAQTRPGTPEKRAQRLNAALTDPALSGMTDPALSGMTDPALSGMTEELGTLPREMLEGGGSERRQGAWLTRWGYLCPHTGYQVRCGTLIS